MGRRNVLVASVLMALTSLMGACRSGIPDYGRCVGAGTSVGTPSGPVPIEKVSVGTKVTTGDIEGRIAVGVVKAVRRSKSTDLRRFVLGNGSVLEATGEHPIATPSGFRRSGELRVADSVLTLGGASEIKNITSVPGSHAVFDLSVEPGNTFFAGGVLVHNKPPMPRNRDLAGHWVGISVTQQASVWRLHLAPDGRITLVQGRGAAWTGRLPESSGPDSSTWFFQEYEIVMNPVGGTRKPGSLSLTLDVSALDGTFSVKDSRRPAKLRFLREREMMSFWELKPILDAAIAQPWPEN